MLKIYSQKFVLEASTFGSSTCCNKVALRLFSIKVNEDGSPHGFTRITVPHKIAQNFERYSQRKLDKKTEIADEKKKKKGTAKGPLVISCNRKVYNFYQGQRFDAYNVATMVSCGWKNKKRVGDAFTLMPYGANPSYQDYDEEPVSFNALGISQDMCLGLNELGVDVPTEIQMLTIPSLLNGNNVVCAAETGSGKTLAYLLPTLERLQKRKELLKYQDPKFNNINMPNTVILTPNRELCNQVMSVAESLQPYADFTPYCVLGGELTSDDTGKMKRIPMDLLITSPGKLKTLLKKQIIKAKYLQHIIIDESDTLLDESFIEEIREICRRFKVMAAEQLPEDLDSGPDTAGAQLVLVSATMPRGIEELVDSVLPVEQLETITSRGLHTIMPHVQQKFLRVGPDSKNDILAKLLQRDMNQNVTTLVFVKNTQTCHFVTKMLKELGISCLKLHGGMERDERSGVWEKFVEGYSDVLIATDIASRGLDSIHVSHVINFDCPSFMSDYIHRVGRVGRIGQKAFAKVTTLVSQKYEVDLIWRIEVCARQMKPLSDVNANISKVLEAVKNHKDWEPLTAIAARKIK